MLARVRRVESVLDLETGAWSAPAGETLRANDIGRVIIETQHPLPFDPYEQVRASGAAILIDAATQHTVAAGMLRETVNA
jgi:sulfate adenylyltransferase subunit 1